MTSLCVVPAALAIVVRVSVIPLADDRLPVYPTRQAKDIKKAVISIGLLSGPPVVMGANFDLSTCANGSAMASLALVGIHLRRRLCTETLAIVDICPAKHLFHVGPRVACAVAGAVKRIERKVAQCVQHYGKGWMFSFAIDRRAR